MNPAYVLDGLTYSYGGADVIEIDHLHIEAGEITALIGPNGAGKSSLLNLLAFITRLRTGSLHLFGESVDENSSVEAKRRIGLVAQDPIYSGAWFATIWR